MTKTPSLEGVEKSVLSCLMQDQSHFANAIEQGLTEECFFHPIHREFYQQLHSIHRKGDKFSLVSFSEYHYNKGTLDKYGGPAFLTELLTYSPTAAHMSHHIAELREYQVKREAIESAEKLKELSLDINSNSEDIQNALRMATERTSALFTGRTKVYTLKEACESFVGQLQDAQKNEGIIGIPTGIPELDHATGGMRRGDVWVIAAYPGEGKSTLMLQIGANTAKQSYKSLAFLLEMNKESGASRLISYCGKIHADVLQGKRVLTKGDFQRIQRGINQVIEMPLELVEDGGMNMAQIESIATRHRDSKGLDVLIIDYIQIITRDPKKQATEALEEVSGQLKQLAKKLNCTILTGSQRNDDGKLKAARKIGEDASVIINISPEEGLILPKNRDGLKGVKLPLFQQEGMNCFKEQQYEQPQGRY